MIVVVGISTAITMARFRILHFHSSDAAPFIAIQFWDISSFAVLFALAILAGEPEYHRRLVLLASCCSGERLRASRIEFRFRWGVAVIAWASCETYRDRGSRPSSYAFRVIVGRSSRSTVSGPRWVAIANAILR